MLFAWNSKGCRIGNINGVCKLVWVADTIVITAKQITANRYVRDTNFITKKPELIANKAKS